jgi:hypothetical protein
VRFDMLGIGAMAQANVLNVELHLLNQMAEKDCVRSKAYEAVTVPVLISAELLPGERPDGTDTFILHFPVPAKNAAESENRVDNAQNQWNPPDRGVVVLQLADVDEKTARGKNIRYAVGSNNGRNSCASSICEMPFQKDSDFRAQL